MMVNENTFPMSEGSIKPVIFISEHWETKFQKWDLGKFSNIMRYSPLVTCFHAYLDMNISGLIDLSDIGNVFSFTIIILFLLIRFTQMFNTQNNP